MDSAETTQADVDNSSSSNGLMGMAKIRSVNVGTGTLHLSPTANEELPAAMGSRNSILPDSSTIPDAKEASLDPEPVLSGVAALARTLSSKRRRHASAGSMSRLRPSIELPRPPEVVAE